MSISYWPIHSTAGLTGNTEATKVTSIKIIKVIKVMFPSLQTKFKCLEHYTTIQTFSRISTCISHAYYKCSNTKLNNGRHSSPSNIVKTKQKSPKLKFPYFLSIFLNS